MRIVRQAIEKRLFVVDSHETILKHYLELFCAVGDHDTAFFGLLHQGKEILPQLIGAYKTESAANVRCFLVEVIWQHRDLSIIPFLGDVLDDEAPEVWKQALDGLVALASPLSRRVLTDAQARFHNRKDMQIWLHEALEQVDEALEERG
jgi:hypothetical protein